MLPAQSTLSVRPSALAPLGGSGAKVPPAAGKAVELARDLEATFLGLLLKEMRQTLEPDGGLFAGDSGDVHGGLFDLFMGQHLASAGGVGLAAAITRYLPNSHADAVRPPALVPGS